MPARAGRAGRRLGSCPMAAHALARCRQGPLAGPLPVVSCLGQGGSWAGRVLGRVGLGQGGFGIVRSLLQEGSCPRLHFTVSRSRSLVSVTNRAPITKVIEGEADRIPEAVVDIAGRRHHREGGGWQEAAEPAVADVIGQRHGRVADAGREELDQSCRDRAVDHGHVDHHHGEQGDDPQGLRIAEAAKKPSTLTLPGSFAAG
jgi:hypothetical protein